MPRYFIFTAIIVTICAVATIVAASDQAAGRHGNRVIALR